MSHWILIADASSARIFLATTPQHPMELARKYNNPTGRMRTQELTSDGPGRISKSASPGTRAATDPHTTAHDASAERFARELATALRKELDDGAFTSLAIAAPPHFLGMLRTHLDAQVAGRVVASLPRDLVNASAIELPPHVESLFPHARTF